MVRSPDAGPGRDCRCAMQAAAEASIKAGCTETASKAKSLAKVRARKKPTETCVEEQDRVGAGRATTSGKATARAVRLPQFQNS